MKPKTRITCRKCSILCPCYHSESWFNLWIQTHSAPVISSYAKEKGTIRLSKSLNGSRSFHAKGKPPRKATMNCWLVWYKFLDDVFCFLVVIWYKNESNFEFCVLSYVLMLLLRVRKLACSCWVEIAFVKVTRLENLHIDLVLWVKYVRMGDW